jgi:hypothetical protein
MRIAKPHVTSILTAPRAPLELWRLWYRQAQHTATCIKVCACAVLVFNFQKGCTCELRAAWDNQRRRMLPLSYGDYSTGRLNILPHMSRSMRMRSISFQFS